MPPRWTPLAKPTRLKEDSGTYFRDKNAARFPEHPMEPAVLAILATSPATIWDTVDVLACGSTMGNLLRFVRSQDKPFRMLVELVHGTVFFIRRENSPTELIPGVYGYGHTFPEAYTTWDTDVKGSASHQRLIQYSFGGLQFVVRFEGNGYIPRSPAICKRSRGGAIDDLVPDLMNHTVSEGVSKGSRLNIHHKGAIVDDNTIFDLKTRSIKKRSLDILADELPRLWVSQIPVLVVAYHDRGTFDDIEVRDVRKDVELFERTHNEELSKLAVLIHWLIAEVQSRDDGKLELCYAGTGELELREQRADAGHALSADIKVLLTKEGDTGPVEIGWIDDDDYTACTAECGYCGRCTY